MSGAQIFSTGGIKRGRDINKDTNLSLIIALASVAFKKQFNFQSIVRGRVYQWLVDDSTEESKQLRFAMRKKTANCLNNKSAATEHFDVILCRTKKCSRNTNQTRFCSWSIPLWLWGSIPKAAAVFCNCFFELFSEQNITMKYITGGN